VDTHPLLLDEPPLLLRPTLACVLAHAGLTPGDRQALWTQQLNYWIQYHRKNGHHKDHYRDGRWWVWNTIEAWQAQFPFWSRSTIKRVIGCSVEGGVTLKAHYSEVKYDRTNWYAIDFERLDELTRAYEEARSPSGQTDPIKRVDLPQFNGSNWDDEAGQTGPLVGVGLDQPISETTTDFPETERQRIWSQACKELEMQMTQATYTAWVRPLRLAGVTGENGSRRAVIHCPNAYVYDWCRHRLDLRFRCALAGALHVAADDVAIEYVVEGGPERGPWTDVEGAPAPFRRAI
jgi:hypothetical protein